MKKLFPFFVGLILLFFTQSTISSCTKTVTKTVTVTDTLINIKNDTITKYLANNSVAYLLFGKKWIVDSLYNNYTGPNTGTIVYARGGSNNSIDVSNYFVVLWPDGNQLFYNGSSYSNFLYSFNSADSTELIINNPSADYAKIVKLNTTQLTIYDSTHSALSYYVYQP